MSRGKVCKVFTVCRSFIGRFFVKGKYRGYVMAMTSLNLSDHWKVVIKNEVANGCYDSTSEVRCNSGLTALRVHLAEGEAQALEGDFVENYSIDKLLEKSDREG